MPKINVKIGFIIRNINNLCLVEHEQLFLLLYKKYYGLLILEIQNVY